MLFYYDENLSAYQQCTDNLSVLRALFKRLTKMNEIIINCKYLRKQTLRLKQRFKSSKVVKLVCLTTLYNNVQIAVSEVIKSIETGKTKKCLQEQNKHNNC